MNIPERLLPLVELGTIDRVVRPLMSGKEAAVFLVESDGERRVAKVYKEANHRSFRQRAAYTEGRKVRNTRQMRAMGKHSKYGKAEEEAAWRSAEVDAIYRLQHAGVRVPVPYDFVDGVLVMELIAGPGGEPAPRLVDLALDEDEAKALFQALLREVVKMLCAGVVHGDLSDFNVLLSESGPVIIDFPQAVDPAANNNARKLLVRDVKNLTSFLARHAPDLKKTNYGEEMWGLYENNQLLPDTVLTGRFKGSERRADTMSLLEEIEHAEREARARRDALGLPPPRARASIVRSAPDPHAKRRGKKEKPEPKKKAAAAARGPETPRAGAEARGGKKRGRGAPHGRGAPQGGGAPQRVGGQRVAPVTQARDRDRVQPPSTDPAHANPKRRRRRRGKKPAAAYDPLDELLIIGD